MGDPDQPRSDPPVDRFDVVLRDFIDFINLQVGAYMDAMAGFAGHCARVERQVHRICRASGVRPDGVVVNTSYEDPTKPEFVINRIERADRYLAQNERGGGNEQQLARSMVVFLYTYWEDSARPRLAKAKRCDLNDVRSDVMGDLRLLRHAVLHGKGILERDHAKLKVLGDMFTPSEPVRFTYEGMHRIFVTLKQECAKLLCQGLGVTPPVDLSSLKDVAMQNLPRGPVGPTGARPPE